MITVVESASFVGASTPEASVAAPAGEGLIVGLVLGIAGTALVLKRKELFGGGAGSGSKSSTTVGLPRPGGSDDPAHAAPL